jgi:tetratricopeptide (TPR) repeat protein
VGNSPQDENGRRALAQAAMKVGDLAPSESLDRYGEAVRYLEALARVQPQDTALKRENLNANHKLGMAQYARGNLLAALSTFSRALQLAESAGADGSADSGAKHALAAANFSMGEVLVRNGETDAAVARLRKALELYGEFAGVAPALRDTTPAGYEHALAQLASSASPERRATIEADLTPFLAR